MVQGPQVSIALYNTYITSGTSRSIEIILLPSLNGPSSQEPNVMSSRYHTSDWSSLNNVKFSSSDKNTYSSCNNDYYCSHHDNYIIPCAGLVGTCSCLGALPARHWGNVMSRGRSWRWRRILTFETTWRVM